MCFTVFLILSGGFFQAESAQSFTLKGRAEFYSQSYSNALAYFEKALQLEPRNLEAVLGRLDSRAYLKQRNEAFAQAAKVFDSQSEQAGAVDVHLLLWKRKAADAEKLLNDLISKSPGYFYFYFQLGSLQLQKKNFDQSIKTLKKCTTLKPGFAPAFYKLGDAYRNKNDVNGVVSAWNKYAEMVPRYGTRYDYVVKYLKSLSGQ